MDREGAPSPASITSEVQRDETRTPSEAATPGPPSPTPVLESMPSLTTMASATTVDSGTSIASMPTLEAMTSLAGPSTSSTSALSSSSFIPPSASGSSSHVNYGKNRGRKAPSDEHVCFKCREEDNKDDGSPPKPKTPREIPWIFCDNCKKWFHQECVNIEEYAANLVDKYHCSACEPIVGPSIYKKVLLNHRYNFDVIDEANLKPQVGTKAWVEHFVTYEASIQPCPLDVMIVYPSGHSFHQYFDQDAEWRNPVMIEDVDGLKMQLPEADFDMHKLYDLVGPEEIIDTIDVYMQLSSKMSFKSFYDRWNENPRPRLYNMLSFEFSHTKLMDIVRAPELMYRLSWVHKFWPEEQVEYDDIITGTYQGAVVPDHINCRPDVAMFCLLGMGGSYTEFHIDFGGSSVWYHVFKGQKIFYVVEPTEENLEKFVKWTNSENRSETWFGDCIPREEIHRVVIDPGKTVMIPSGWIHAVYTPIDSMVFGGNFIHDLNIVRQLKVYEVEQACNYDENFMFPQFELSNWYGAKALTERLKNATEDFEILPPYILEGLKAYAKILPHWNRRSPCHPHFKSVVRTIENGLKKYAKLREKATPKRKRTSAGSKSAESSPAKSNLPPLKLRINLKGDSAPTSVSSPPPKKHKKDRDEKAIQKAMKLPKKDSQSLANMFSERTSSGRKIKPSAWLQERGISGSTDDADSPSTSKGFFDDYDEEQRKNVAQADRIGELEARRLGDTAYASDDDDLSLIANAGRKKSRPVPSKAGAAKPAPKAPPKQKKVETAKQRLAKKMFGRR
uniref:[Histone H3]-dimethyl-L-lysine(36) demethylase n=1 Tax=Panagrellus redivivus TaxID=6233 RepID=A0A7E4W909_PANRE